MLAAGRLGCASSDPLNRDLDRSASVPTFAPKLTKAERRTSAHHRRPSLTEIDLIACESCERSDNKIRILWNIVLERVAFDRYSSNDVDLDREKHGGW